MKSRNKNATPQIENAVSRAVNFEISIADLARRSERRAWIVAMSAVLMSLILSGGYFYMLPLKQKVPYLIMADAYTGTATVARLKEDFKHQSITTSEAINRSNVAHFVIARESYDIALMKLRDWATVYTMSSPGVASEYTALHTKTNPESPYKTYGNNRALRVKILSTQLIGGSADSPPKGATVRFQRIVYDKGTGESMPLDSKIATLEFQYKSNLTMDEQYRVENPLGFQVTNYRVDNDYAPSPPVGIEALPQATGATDASPMTHMPAPEDATATTVGNLNIDPAAINGMVTPHPDGAPTEPVANAPANGAGSR